MLDVNAVIGGEGNGGVMLPDVHIGRDAPVAATLLLQLLTSSSSSLAQLKVLIHTHLVFSFLCLNMTCAGFSSSI